MTLANRGPTFGLELVSSYPGSKIRQFSYPERSWTINPWRKWYEPPFQPKDPFRDFTPCSIEACREPHPLCFSVGNQDWHKVMEYVCDPRKWFRMDHLSYYTYWSAIMYTADYSNEHDFFTFYMAGGETSSMYYWVDKSVTGFDDSDVNLAKIIDNIWMRVHPPSYYLFHRLKIYAGSNPKRNGYVTASFRKMKLVFQNLSQTFLIMTQPFQVKV
jgi:hypothetical protein